MYDIDKNKLKVITDNIPERYMILIF